MKQAEVTMRGNGLYDVEYMPDMEGPCRLDVTYAGHAVPNRYQAHVYELDFVVMYLLVTHAELNWVNINLAPSVYCSIMNIS